MASRRLRADWKTTRLRVLKTADDVGIEGRLDRQRRARHRHHQAARDAVAGDVADGHRQAAVLERQDVVEVAADLGRRQVDVRQLDAVQLRRQIGQDRALDLARGLELDPLALALGDPPNVRRHVVVAVGEDLLRFQEAQADQHRQRREDQRQTALHVEEAIVGEQQRRHRGDDDPQTMDATIVVHRS